MVHARTAAGPSKRRQAMRTVAAAAALAMLAGCVSGDELRQEDENRCLAYGFERGSTQFADCLQRQYIARCYNTWIETRPSQFPPPPACPPPRH